LVRVDRNPLANAVFGLHSTRLAGNGDGDGSRERERDLRDLRAKEALKCSPWLIMTVCSSALGLVSSQMVRYVNDRTLQRSFGGFLIVLAVLVWLGHPGEGDRSAPLPAPAQVGIGSLTGALCGLFVVGGAQVSVPLLERAAGYSQQRAKAMVLLMLVPASAIGLVIYSAAGYVRWDEAIALAVGR